MRRYLFIGGPWDGQWLSANGHYAWLMPGRGRQDCFGVAIGRTLYYRRSVFVPGWLFPIDVYVLDGVHEIDRSVILPGYAYGQMRWSPDGWNRLPGGALREAVTEFNRERLGR